MEPHGSGNNGPAPGFGSAKKVWAVAGVIAVAVSALYAFFAVDVCEEQLANTGEAVEICRSMTLTDLPVIVAGVLMLALLGVFYNEVSGFGVTLKRAVGEAKQSADDAKTAAQDAVGAVQEIQQYISTQLMSAVQQTNVSASQHTSAAGGSVYATFNAAEKEETVGLSDLSDVVPVVEAMGVQLQGKYVDGQVTRTYPIELVTAIELVAKLRSGDSITAHQAEAIVSSVMETAQRYGDRLNESLREELIASGALVVEETSL